MEKSATIYLNLRKFILTSHLAHKNLLLNVLDSSGKTRNLNRKWGSSFIKLLSCKEDLTQAIIRSTLKTKSWDIELLKGSVSTLPHFGGYH